MNASRNPCRFGPVLAPYVTLNGISFDLRKIAHIDAAAMAYNTSR